MTKVNNTIPSVLLALLEFALLIGSPRIVSHSRTQGLSYFGTLLVILASHLPPQLLLVFENRKPDLRERGVGHCAEEDGNQQAEVWFARRRGTPHEPAAHLWRA